VTAASAPTSFIRAAVALAAAVLAALALTATASAASCADQVVADWYDNGRVDGSYELHCYRDAIKELPEDIKAYSSAKDDINRALAARTREQANEGQGAPPTTTPAQTTPEPGETAPVDTTPAATTPVETTPAETTPASTPDKPAATTDGGPVTEAAGSVDTSGPSSVPMPLIVLGGLALLLLAAGSAGYVTRRLQGRSGGGGEPPAAA
jgi:hypothetical protein